MPSRNEYLQSLNRMRANYQNQGNPLINREDDNGNVGNELSAFAYMETNPASSAPEQASKSNRNGWQRTVDTVHSGISNITEGVTNFLDDVWDFAVVSTSWLTGLFSGIGSWMFGKNHSFKEGWDFGTGYVKPATTFEWEHALNNWWNQMDIGHAVLSGDMFTGKWGNDWTKLGDKEQTAKVHQNSWASEWGDFGKNVQKVEQGAGYILPSLVLAYFTGGTSIGAQVGIQAGLAGATALGGGFEQATKEGADYGHALGYGATKGAISAGTTAILMGVGGAVASKTGSGLVGKAGGKVGEKVFQVTGSKGAEVFASKATQVALRAGLSYGTSMANQMSEPYIQSIYDNGNAIQEAFGDNEKTKKYLERCASNATVSAITTAIVTAGREGVDLAMRGRDGYMAKYYTDKAITAQKHIAKELDKINNDLQSGKITTAQAEMRLENLNRYNATVERSGRIALEYAEKIYNNAVDAQDAQSQAVKNAFSEQKPLDFGKNKDVMRNLTKVGYTQQQLNNIQTLSKTFINRDWTNNTVRLTSNDGNTTVEMSPNGQLVEHTIGNETYSVPATITDGKMQYNVPSKNAVLDMAVVLGSAKQSGLPTQASVKPEALNIPAIKAEGINTSLPVTMSAEVATKIMTSKNSKNIQYFLDKGIKGNSKNNYVMKASDGKYIVVEPYEEDGIQKYGIIAINNKTNQITNVKVVSQMPSPLKYTIEPKNDVTMVMSTKLENQDGTAKRYMLVDVPNELGGWSVAPVTNTSNPSFFVYAKNPLRETELSQKLPFAKIAKKFNIPTSLEKTYSKKLADKNPLSVIEFISRYANTDPKGVMKVLGYDAFEYKDGSVIINNGAQMLGGNIKYGETKGTNDYRSLVKRIGRESANEELERYIGKNGRELKTIQDRQNYTQLIKDNNAYTDEYVFDREVYVVDNKVYSKDMLSIANENNKLGANTKFIVDVNNKFELCSGFYDNKGTIYHILDRNDPRPLVVRNAHEVCHYLEDVYHLWAVSNIGDLMENWARKYPEEHSKWLNRYREAYTGKYVIDEDFDTKIDSELLAEIYSRDIVLEDQKLQQAIIDTVNKVRALGKEKVGSLYYQSIENDNFKPIKTRYALTLGVKEQSQNIVSDRKGNVSLDFSWSTKYIAEDLQKIKAIPLGDYSTLRNDVVVFKNFEIKGELAKILTTSKPIITDKMHLYKNLNKDPWGDKNADSWHDLLPSEYAKAIEGLNKPLLISRNKNGLAVLTNVKDGEGRPLLVAIQENYVHKTKGLDYECYRIKSVYAKQSLSVYTDAVYYKESLGETKVLFDANKKSQRQGLIPSSGTNNNVNDNLSNVKFTLVNGVENYDGKTTIDSDPSKTPEERNEYSLTLSKGKDVAELLEKNPYPVVEKDDNPTQYVLVAPLYKSDAKTPADFYKLSKDVISNFVKECRRLAKQAGCKYSYLKARGIYTNDNNYRLREPSTLVELGKVDAKNADLAGSLMADLGYQQQESVIVYNYVTEEQFDKLSAYNQAIAYEVAIPKGKANLIVNRFHEQGIDATVLNDKIVFLKSCVFDFGDGNTYNKELETKFEKDTIELLNRLIKEGVLNGKAQEIFTKHQANERYLVEGDRRGVYRENERAITAKEPTKIISDLKAKSSNVLIEAGADVSKSVKYRLESVKTAFDNALKEVVPDNGFYKISFIDTKQSFAELNLARPKDRGIAVDNLIKRLNNTKITLVSTLGEDTVRLGDLLTIKQEQQARDIMLATLNGKAEPTKLANWVKSLSLAKLETSAVKDHIKLANRLERRIEASSHLNFGYGNAPVPELTVFKNILNSVPRFWDNKGVLAFADSVLINYSDANIKPLLDQYGVAYDENIRAVADTLKSLIVPGRHLDPRVQVLADNLLRLLYNNLENLDASVKSENVKQAEYDANVIQSMGNGRKHDGKVSGTVKKVLANFDNSVTSVNDFLKRRAPGTNLQKFVENETGEYENKEIELNEKYENLLFKKLPTKEVKKLINKKFTFKGEKISYGVALDRLNSYKTLGDKFFNAKGSITNADSTRGEVIYTPEDIANLEQAIPQALLDYNDAVLEVLNKELKADIKALYKHATHTELVTLDDNSIWYNISRVSDNFFGVNMGGVSMRDFNLSMFNQRVVSRADINFDLDLQAHLRAYLRKAFKVLVWTPYINKLNTLLNTRVYGVTNNKIYQQNIIGFDKQMDMLVHQVLGVPFETKVSTMSKVAGKVVGNLNAVRVATIQAGWRTVSSAPMFAKYFGAKVALQGQLQNLKNGDLLAFNKNLKIIKQYSPYLAKRFSSSEVALAETGVKVANKIMKVTGTPLRFGDASIHLTLGFAMAQVKAQQEGYGAPYTDSNNKRACFLLEQASKSTQPTNAIGRVAGFRYGNSVSKYLFGLYGSMKQVFYDALVAPIEDIVTTKPRITAMENAIKGHEAKIDEYAQLAEEAKERMDNASTDKEYEEAEKDYEKYNYKKESHERAKKNTEDNLNDFKRTHTSKALFNRLSGALGGFMFASLMYVAIRYAISVLEGKKSVKDFSVKGFAIDTAEQAFMNSLPYLSTLYASIKNNSDLSIATLDNLNNTVDAIKKLVEAVESQNGGHITGATWNLLKEVSQYFGIPLSAMVRLVNGAWYNIDKGSNVDFHNWLGMLSGAKLRSNYSTAVKNGDKETAIANLDVWTSNHSIKTSDNVLEEIYRLNKAGETGVAPSAIPTKYTNEKGDEIKLTKAQINAFRSEYAKADKDVSKLLEVEDYKKQDDNTKASLIKRVYSAYRESAQARALGIAPNSKLGKLLFYTNGDVDMAKYIMSLQNLSVIKEDKKHTRKENVISAINKMAGFSKQEKLLLAYLSGYNVSEKNQQSMIRFLVSRGFDKKEAKAYLGLKK